MSEQIQLRDTPGTSVRALVNDSVFEDATVTIDWPWLHVDFAADDLPDIALPLEDLGTPPDRSQTSAPDTLGREDTA